MKKAVLFTTIIVFSLSAFAQNKKKKKQARDTIKTEVIDVISTYNPTIADAFKIRKNPKSVFDKKSQKIKLSYSIFSAPVASTFIPKSGALKGVKVSPPERLFDNYVAAGYGNFNAPFLELYLHDVRKFRDEFGIYAKYQSAEDGVKNAVLNNGFRDINLGGYYRKEDQLFDWKLGVNAFQKTFNWYGLPSSIGFTANTLDNIDEELRYSFFEIDGEIEFDSPFLKKVQSSLSLFGDQYDSDELKFEINSELVLPLNFLGNNASNLQLNASISFLSGDFQLNYASTNALDYSFLNVRAHPVYRFESAGFNIKLGSKIVGAFDLENSLTDFLLYPDVEISYPLVSNFIDLYAGVDGDLYANSFQRFSNQNPFVSPTLFMTQTNEQYNLFGGLSGKIGSDLSFNIRGSFKSVEDQPLFFRNNSKSTGTNSIVGGTPLRGYEYGNSFSVIYDDIETITLSGEIEMMLSKRFTFGVNASYYNYSLTNQLRAWNLPDIEAGATMRYERNKWYFSADVFYIGQREDILYSGTYLSNISGTQILEGFADLNFNTGYHFNPFVSVFIRANNVLNNNYERFANFNVQGFQVLGGITYKFDF